MAKIDPVKKKVKEITAQCQALGVYKPEFDKSIKNLRQILVEKDKAYEQYLAGGGSPTVVTVAASGQEVYKTSPYLATVNELQRLRLPYMETIGLTAKALQNLKKKEAESHSRASTIADLLSDLKREMTDK